MNWSNLCLTKPYTFLATRLPGSNSLRWHLHTHFENHQLNHHELNCTTSQNCGLFLCYGKCSQLVSKQSNIVARLRKHICIAVCGNVAYISSDRQRSLERTDPGDRKSNNKQELWTSKCGFLISATKKHVHADKVLRFNPQKMCTCRTIFSVSTNVYIT